jgi:hypothetical protein
MEGGMARKRTLSAHQLLAARVEYENTPISARGLALKFGMSDFAVRDWIKSGGWVKAAELHSYDGEGGEQAFERDLAAAIKALGEREEVPDLKREVAAFARECAGIPRTVPAEAEAADAPAEPPADRPQTPGNTAEAAPEPEPEKGRIVRFPGTFVPPPTETSRPPPVTSLPARSKTELAALRVHLATMRSDLAVQHMTQLAQHKELIWDYHHLAEVYFNPSKFVDVAALPPDEGVKKLEEVSKAAGRLLLATERDTVANTMLAINKAVLSTLEAERRTLGIGPQQPGRRGGVIEFDPEDEAPREPPPLDTEKLRQVRAAMNLMQGHMQERNEPPKPPPPDDLSDIMPPAD